MAKFWSSDVGAGGDILLESGAKIETRTLDDVFGEVDFLQQEFFSPLRSRNVNKRANNKIQLRAPYDLILILQCLKNYDRKFQTYKKQRIQYRICLKYTLISSGITTYHLVLQGVTLPTPFFPH